MDKTELRGLALDEKERRRRLYRDYDLAADGPVAPKVTVSAAAVVDNKFNAETYRLAKGPTLEGLMLPWMAPERSTEMLSQAQARSLTEQMQHHDTWLDGFFRQLLNLIDSGAITTKEKIENGDWPA